MFPYILYQPFHFKIERLLNDPSPSKQGHKATRCDFAPVQVFKSLNPRWDLEEDAEKNIVTATFELPGFSKDDVQINVQNGKLTVSAASETDSKKSKHNADSGYTFKECLHGKFSHTLQLPQGVEDEQIKATMENGLLTVTFPKTLPELAPKKIMIQASD